MQEPVQGTAFAHSEDALGGYERLANFYERRIYPNVEGIRSTIRFLGPGNEKIRALKAETWSTIIRKEAGTGRPFLGWFI